MSNSYQEQIERNIEETRSRIDRNLDEIQDRLSPGEAIDEAVRFVKGSGGDLAGSVARGIRNNPVPAALIGAGVGWMLLSQLSSHAGAAGSGASSSSESLTEKGERIKERAAEMTEGAKRKARAAVERATDYTEQATDQAREQAREQARKAASATGRFVDEHPLSLAVLGLAVGAGLAAVLQSSRRENELLGESSDRIKAAARETAREQVEKVRTAAVSAGEAAKEELTRDDATQASAHEQNEPEKQAQADRARQAVSKARPESGAPEGTSGRSSDRPAAGKSRGVGSG